MLEAAVNQFPCMYVVLRSPLPRHITETLKMAGKVSHRKLAALSLSHEIRASADCALRACILEKIRRHYVTRCENYTSSSKSSKIMEALKFLAKAFYMLLEI